MAYCQEEKRWTLSLPKDGVSPDADELNPCDWYAASSESEDFDVSATASSQWVVRTPTKGVVPLSRHFMACHDCIFTQNFCGDFGTCSKDRWRGNCTCEHGYYGLRCEYQPSQCLEINQRGEGFVIASKYYYELQLGAEAWEALPPWERGLYRGAYNRPIYTNTSLGDNQTLSDDTAFIVFTGVRWILSYKRLFLGLKDVNNRNGLMQYFSSQFHGHFTNYSALYVSEPVYIDGPVDDTASPLKVLCSRCR